MEIPFSDDPPNPGNEQAVKIIVDKTATMDVLRYFILRK